MIVFEGVTKSFPARAGRRNVVLDDFSGLFPPGVNVGILGRNGAGKSTLMRLISGGILPDRGRVLRKGRISWPLGFNGGFHGSLTGRQNVQFICDIYGAHYPTVMRYVEDFAEIGDYINMPLKTYSSGMRARLAFGTSMAIDFNYYLIDEVIAVGDKTFQQRCKDVFTQKRATATVLLVSHSSALLKRFCDIGGVLQNGRLTFYDTLDEAIAVHAGAQGVGATLDDGDDA